MNQLLQQAVAFHQAGRLGDAEPRYLQILALDPGNAMARHFLGMLRFQQGRHGEALDLLQEALRIDPSSAQAWSNYGNVLRALSRLTEALNSYDRALAIQPDFVDALYNQGNTLCDLGRMQDALSCYDKFLALRPQFAEAWNNRGLALQGLNRLADAASSYERALALKPDFALALYNRGIALLGLNAFTKALSSFDTVLRLNPGMAEAWNQRGNALHGLRRLPDALACYAKALALRPDYAEALTNQANTLREMRRFDEALDSFGRALAIAPGHADALHGRGMMQWIDLRDCDAACADLERLVAIEPGYDYARGDLLHLRMHSADWRDMDRELGTIDHDIAAGRHVANPFVYQAMSSSLARLQACSVLYTAHRHPPAAPLCTKATRRREKLRIGYVAGEFREHATACLTAGLFESHDRDRFDIVAFDSGFSDASPMRRRLEAGFDRFIDIAALPDSDAAARIAAEEIDILINLNGYFGKQRMGVFAHRPAPVQVNYLGFPGTLGATYIDYILADRFVIPEPEQAFYTEKVVYLPDSYQVNDSWRETATNVPSRRDQGLPAKGFVFCNFNQTYKLTPSTFAIFMRLLQQTEGSVLWLLKTSNIAVENLRREAEAQGVRGDRLVFASYVPAADHLARLAMADLCLDGLPYGAHTTASDALWAGVPLVTCYGESFAGRVAASLLHASGLSDLVTPDLVQYEALALALSHDPDRLQSVRSRLASNRTTAPLFDTDRFRRHMEAAYMKMWEIAEGGRAAKLSTYQFCRGTQISMHRRDTGPSGRADEAYALNKRGIAQLQAGQFAEALACFEQVLAVAPRHVDALYYSGVCRLNLDNPKGALVAFDDALRLSPGFAEAHQQTGLRPSGLGTMGRCAAKLQ